MLVVLVALVAACGPDIYTPTLKSPVPSPQGACEGAYLAWIGAPRISDQEHDHDQWKMSALKPVFEACDLEGLAAASQRYPRLTCLPPPGPRDCSFKPELSDDLDKLARDNGFAPLCDGSAVPFYMDLDGTFEQTALCRDIARYPSSSLLLPGPPVRA